MNKKTVLVMDDDASICMTLKKLVENKGMAFIQADNLMDGCMHIGQFDPDVAIVDYEFQHGRNVCSIVEQLKQKVKKVIILTSHCPDQIRREHPELNFAQIIYKTTVGASRAVELASK